MLFPLLQMARAADITATGDPDFNRERTRWYRVSPRQYAGAETAWTVVYVGRW